ncbi:prolipoprotein diacylglyceryl transferase [Pedobacter sandarakinus]|uniref:prolipoprotein diacylglyceryl transferase n=1 Tax=Pedobacter sandarakinus TaxID=353156 RepID=UPI00224574FC|nr:prolipoprotein diacylglyceryl transferase family protein [Pedobacter sandarakinus]MCX2574698.1 prolipoprotein diacylglyceryl transferase [Pedobacter sandarakinus]
MINSSPFPFQFEFLEQRYHYHYLFETLAFIVGVRVYYYLKKGIADPISDENRLWIMLGAMVGALVGSRLLAVLETPGVLHHLTFNILYQSKTIVGGLLGGLVGVEITKKIIRVNIASGDIYVVPIIIALFIGRIGCFSMGIDEPTFGVETDFFAGIDLGDGVLRHPIMLYEMAYLILLLLVFKRIKTSEMPNGDRFKLFMVLYFLFRFLIEFIKPYQPLYLNLSSIHWAGLVVIVYYYKFILRTFSVIAQKNNQYGQY